MKGTEKCQVYYNGLVMEECKACCDGGGLEVDNAVMVLHWKSDGVATEQHSFSG